MAERFADPGEIATPDSAADQGGGAAQDQGTQGEGDGKQPWHTDKRFREFATEAKAWKEFKAAGGSLEQFNKFKDDLAKYERGEHPNFQAKATEYVSQRDAQWKKALQDLGYQVWWTGYEVGTNAANYTKSTVEILINKGWVKGE